MSTSEMETGLNAAKAANIAYDLDEDGVNDIDLSDGLDAEEIDKIKEIYGVEEADVTSWAEENEIDIISDSNGNGETAASSTSGGATIYTPDDDLGDVMNEENQNVSGEADSCGMGTETSGTQAGASLVNVSGTVDSINNSLNQIAEAGGPTEETIDALEAVGESLLVEKEKLESLNELVGTALALDGLDGSEDGNVTFAALFTEAAKGNIEGCKIYGPDGKEVSPEELTAAMEGKTAEEIDELLKGYVLSIQIGDSTVDITYLTAEQLEGVTDATGAAAGIHSADGGSWGVSITDKNGHKVTMVNNGDGSLSLDEMGINDELQNSITELIGEIDESLETIEGMIGDLTVPLWEFDANSATAKNLEDYFDQVVEDLAQTQSDLAGILDDMGITADSSTTTGDTTANTTTDTTGTT